MAYPVYSFAPYVKMPPGPTDLSDWAGVDLARVSGWVQQHWRARFEWKVCLGIDRWPRGNFIWNTDEFGYDNIITAVTETTITCANAHWIGDGRNLWRPTNSPPEDEDAVWIPTSYHAVIEAPLGGPFSSDEWVHINATMNNVRVFRTNVVSRDSATTVTVGNMRDWVTSLRLSSLSELVGCRVNMIKHNGIWPAHRWPPFANAEEIERRETVRAYTTTSLQFHKVKWKVNQFPDGEYDLIVRDQDGRMRRLNIIANGPRYDGDMNEDDELPQVSNDYTTVYFDEQEEEFVPSGRCVIVRANARYELGQEKWQVWRQYSGARALVRAVFWDGNIDRFMSPAGGVTWNEWNDLEEECEPINHTPALDKDMWSEFDEICGAPDASEKNYSPHLYKTLRMIQADQDDDAPTAIEPGVNYTTSKPGVPWMTVPILYRAAGVNAATVAITDYDPVSGEVTIDPPDVPYTPIMLAYTILRFAPISGGVIAGVPGVQVYDNTFLLESPDPWVVFMEANLDPDDVIGISVDVTWGRTRFAPRHITHMRPRFAWIPDTHPISGAVLGGRSVLNYALYGRTGVGTWQRREPSSTFTGLSGKAGVADEPTVGELARWVSLDWNKPYEGPGEGADTADPLQDYYRNFYDGLLPTAQEIKIRHVCIGRTTTPPVNDTGTWVDGTSRYRIHNVNRDHNDIWQYGFGHTETGTATSGGTTFLEDTSKQVGTASGAYYEAPLEQWAGYPYPYYSFIIEIKQAVDILLPDGTTESQLTWVPRLITVCDATAVRVRFEWDEPLPATANGCEWRIREPSPRQNPFVGRRLRMFIDGAWVYRIIGGNDQHGWYFTEPLDDPVPINTRYELLDYKPGGVWRYEEAEGVPEDRPQIPAADPEFAWVAPRGEDEARTGMPDVGPFHHMQSENEPTYVKRYGRIEKYDQIRCKNLHEELAKIEDKFRWRKHPITWTSRADPEVPEDNRWYADGIGSDGVAYPAVIEGTQYNADQAWGLLPDEDDPDPTGFGSREATEVPTGPPLKAVSSGVSIDAYSVSLEAQYAYPKVTGLPVLLASDVDVLTYCYLAPGDPDPYPHYKSGLWLDAAHSAQDDDDQLKNYINFFNFGDGVAFRRWQRWDGADFGGPSQEPDRIGTAIGSLDKPDWLVPNPVDVNTGDMGEGDLIFSDGPYNDETANDWYPPGAAGTGGYIVVGQWAIQRFDVTGGRQMLLT